LFDCDEAHYGACDSVQGFWTEEISRGEVDKLPHSTITTSGDEIITERQHACDGIERLGLRARGSRYARAKPAGKKQMNASGLCSLVA
jgi:hypothetical protein